MIGEVAGIVGSFLSTAMFAPQVIKTLKTRNTEALSAMTLVLAFVGNVFWLINGIALGHGALIFSVSMIMVMQLPLFYVKYCNGEMYLKLKLESLEPSK